MKVKYGEVFNDNDDAEAATQAETVLYTSYNRVYNMLIHFTFQAVQIHQ